MNSKSTSMTEQVGIITPLMEAARQPRHQQHKHNSKKQRQRYRKKGQLTSYCFYGNHIRARAPLKRSTAHNVRSTAHNVRSTAHNSNIWRAENG